jgi:hypothetical protein
MDTRFHVPAIWPAVTAAAPGLPAEGEVGAEGGSEHPPERDAMIVKANKERTAFMTRLQLQQ